MPHYTHVIAISIEADSYLESELIASDISVGLACEGENAFIPAFETDNEGQRVVYLSPEGVSDEAIELYGHLAG